MMSWKTDLMILGGVAVGAYALVYYVFPQAQKQIGAATTQAAVTVGQAVGSGVGAVGSGAVQTFYPTIDPFSVKSVQNQGPYAIGQALGTWVGSLPWIFQPGIKQLGLI